jgi:hypothetical protein
VFEFDLLLLMHTAHIIQDPKLYLVESLVRISFDIVKSWEQPLLIVSHPALNVWFDTLDDDVIFHIHFD